MAQFCCDDTMRFLYKRKIIPPIKLYLKRIMQPIKINKIRTMQPIKVNKRRLMQPIKRNCCALHGVEMLTNLVSYIHPHLTPLAHPTQFRNIHVFQLKKMGAGCPIVHLCSNYYLPKMAINIEATTISPPCSFG